MILLSNYDDRNANTAIHTHIMQGLYTKDEAAVPKIAGPPALEVAATFFRRLQTATVDRTELGEEYSVYLTDEWIAGAAGRSRPTANRRAPRSSRSGSAAGWKCPR